MESNLIPSVVPVHDNGHVGNSKEIDRGFMEHQSKDLVKGTISLC